MMSQSSNLMLILFTVATNAAAQIMLKQGMTKVGAVGLSSGRTPLETILAIGLQPWVILGLFTFAVSMSSHLIVLSRVNLSFAYPFLSLAYVMVATYSFFIFGEDISPARLIGYGLIIAGTLAIAIS